jgi:hypothetical protein
MEYFNHGTVAQPHLPQPMHVIGAADYLPDATRLAAAKK